MSKRYFAGLGQHDCAMGRQRPVNLMRHWPQWAFKAYAMAWITGRGYAR